MPALEYTIIQQDQDQFDTLEDLNAYFSPSASKQVATALDPLIDYTILNPSAAYQES